jgi:hypothetical protein
MGSAFLKDALGRAPDANIIRPSGGALDQQTLNVLATSPSSVLLGDSDTLPRSYLPGASAAAGFTPLPTGLAQTSSGLDVPVVLPDPDTQLLLTATPPSGPVAQAQQVLGELLASWQELPSIPRGVALDLPASLPPGIWGQLLPRIGSAPFLKMVNVSDLLAVAPPPATPSRISTETPGLFTGGYMREIKQQSQHIQWLNSMLPPDGTTQTAPLVDDLYAAESSAFVSNEGKGRAFIDQVNAATKRAFMSTKPLPGQEFTFTSRSGTIPLELGDPGDLTLHFMIQLQSNKLIFPEGSTQSITLDHPNQVADFRVEFKGSGLIQVTANVVAPDGRTIRTTTILVRSTAYNKIALLITALAASILVVMWARRIFRRQAS